MVTVPVPVSMIAPPATEKISDPVEASAVITIGNPIKLGIEDWSKAPESVTTVPEMEPVSVKWQTPGLPDAPGGGESVPSPDRDEVLPEASARMVNVPAGPVTTPLNVTVVGCAA